MRSLIIAAISIVVGCQSTPPPVLATIPIFELTAADGTPFKSHALVGQPYVASFFFTSCGTICPHVMGSVRSVLAEAEDQNLPLRAISITVDPITDTPERLAQYATKENIPAGRWTLLTGSEATLKDVVVKGFMAHIGPREEREGDLFEIGHEGRLMLIDSLGRLRGLYETNPEGQAALVDAVSRI